MKNITLSGYKDDKAVVKEQIGKKAIIIEGDCYNFLIHAKKNSINVMITSPPYYNAREYSNWSNIYLYYSEMFQIIRSSYDILTDDGVFIYNIGDITNNPNIVTSKMGERKITLGAHTILLFEEAGFELVENYIWFKKEPQSQRHKNDGKNTPFYQNPMNTYEHIFIFKKKKSPVKVYKKFINSDYSKWIDSSIVEINPVRKINSKKENILGHTAPFPLEIPYFFIQLFSNKNETVYDPFLGSGTTLIASELLNRIGIGSEISNEYIELVKKRFLS